MYESPYPEISPRIHPIVPEKNKSERLKYPCAKKAHPAIMSAVAGIGKPIEAIYITPKSNQY